MYYLDPGFHRDDESELFLKSKRLDRSVLLSDTKKNIQQGFLPFVPSPPEADKP
jgi:hypothetical protein